METPVRFAGTDTWNTRLQPQLQTAGCETGTTTLSVIAVGVPTTKKRVFVVAVKRNGDDALKSKLARWKQSMERPTPTPPTVGSFLGRQGSFFLKRGRNDKEIFSFSKPTVAITQEQIMARKPGATDLNAHTKDEESLEEAQELTWDDYSS